MNSLCVQAFENKLHQTTKGKIPWFELLRYLMDECIKMFDYNFELTIALKISVFIEKFPNYCKIHFASCLSTFSPYSSTADNFWKRTFLAKWEKKVYVPHPRTYAHVQAMKEKVK